MLQNNSFEGSRLDLGGHEVVRPLTLSLVEFKVCRRKLIVDSVSESLRFQDSNEILRPFGVELLVSKFLEFGLVRFDPSVPFFQSDFLHGLAGRSTQFPRNDLRGWYKLRDSEFVKIRHCYISNLDGLIQSTASRVEKCLNRL